MPHKIMFYKIAFVKFIINMKNNSPGITEYFINAFFSKTFQKYPCSGHFICFLSLFGSHIILHPFYVPQKEKRNIPFHYIILNFILVKIFKNFFYFFERFVNFLYKFLMLTMIFLRFTLKKLYNSKKQKKR